MKGKWFTVYRTEIAKLFKFKLLLHAQSNQKKKYSGNYIPADGESLQFSPKKKSTPVTGADNQASSNNHKPGVIPTQHYVTQKDLQSEE